MVKSILRSLLTRLIPEQSPFYHALSRVYHFPGTIKTEANYFFLETYHGLSVKFSRRIGITQTKRTPEVIVSLTTIPERIGKVSLCLDSLLRQSTKPDQLILWLSESEDPKRPCIDYNSLPAELHGLTQRGLEIRWCKDIGSYRKIIPTLKAHPEALIVTADDDIFYPRRWLQQLVEAHSREPQYIHCHRAHMIRYDSLGRALPYRDWVWHAGDFMGPSPDLLPTGVGGVLYGPGQLHPEVLNEAAFLELCPKADDIWLKAMSLLVGVPCKKVAKNTFDMVAIRISTNRTLSSENYDQDGNDPQIRAVAKQYPVFCQQERTASSSTPAEGVA